MDDMEGTIHSTPPTADKSRHRQFLVLKCIHCLKHMQPTWTASHCTEQTSPFTSFFSETSTNIEEQHAFKHSFTAHLLIQLLQRKPFLTDARRLLQPRRPNKPLHTHTCTLHRPAPTCCFSCVRASHSSLISRASSRPAGKQPMHFQTRANQCTPRPCTGQDPPAGRAVSAPVVPR